MFTTKMLMLQVLQQLHCKQEQGANTPLLSRRLSGSWVSTSISLLSISTWNWAPDVLHMLCYPLTAYVGGDFHTAKRNHQSSTAVAATEHPIWLLT